MADINGHIIIFVWSSKFICTVPLLSCIRTPKVDLHQWCKCSWHRINFINYRYMWKSVFCCLMIKDISAGSVYKRALVVCSNQKIDFSTIFSFPLTAILSLLFNAESSKMNWIKSKLNVCFRSESHSWYNYAAIF